VNRPRICKRLRSPGIDSEESIPPSYVAWRAGTTNRVIVPGRQATQASGTIPWNRFLGTLKRLQIRSGSNPLCIVWHPCAGESVSLMRRIDNNWFEGRIGSRKGIFPVSYVEVSHLFYTSSFSISCLFLQYVLSTKIDTAKSPAIFKAR
jgi:hypothetical protein